MPAKLHVPRQFLRMKFCAAITLLACMGVAQAETPAFDRPGIAFSVTTLPAGSLSWEQGLLDLSRDRSDGITRTEYNAGSLLRVGLGEKIELQVGHAAFNLLRSTGAGAGESLREHGAGDTSLALKVALPALGENLQWALLGSTTLATGNAAFSAGDTAYALGTTLEWSLDERSALAFYANVETQDGGTTLSLSPSYSVALNDAVGLFAEAGYTRNRHLPDDVVAGGGVTWMVAPTVQLDLSANVGLTSDSTDLQASFGVSVFFP